MDREAWQATVHRVAESDMTKVTPHAQTQDFSYPVAAQSQWESCMEVAWFLGSQGPWQCQLHRNASSYCHRKYGAIRALVRIEREGGAAAWVAGTLAMPSLQGH